MGIRFYCPKGHKLNVKEFQAGKKALCPYCGLRVLVPTKSTRVSSKQRKADQHGTASSPTVLAPPGIPSPNAAPSPDPPLIPELASDETLIGGMGSSIIIASTSNAPATAADSDPSLPDSNGVLSAPDNSAANASDASSVFGGSSAGMGSTLAELNRMLADASRSPSAPTTKAPPDDALSSDADTTLWYIRLASGTQLGPATNSIMRHWLAKGRVQADSLVWHQGWPEWQLAGNVFVCPSQSSPSEVAQGMDALLSEEPIAPVVLPPHHETPRELARSKHVKTLIIAVAVAGVLLVAGVIVAILVNSNL